MYKKSILVDARMLFNTSLLLICSVITNQSFAVNPQTESHSHEIIWQPHWLEEQETLKKREAEQSTNLIESQDGYRIQPIYLIPNGAPNNNRAQSMYDAVSAIQRQWSRWGWTFDLTPDIITVETPQTCDQLSQSNQFDQVVNQVKSAGFDNPKIKYPIFANCVDAPGIAAQAQLPGNYSVYYNGVIANEIARGNAGVIGHELGHNFGLFHENCNGEEPFNADELRRNGFPDHGTRGPMCNGGNWPNVFPDGYQFPKVYRAGCDWIAECENNLYEPGPVTLFEAINFEQRSTSFDVGEFNAENFGSVRNDTASSISVATGFMAQICTDVNAQGSCITFAENNSNFINIGINDQASYLNVVKTNAVPSPSPSQQPTPVATLNPTPAPGDTTIFEAESGILSGIASVFNDAAASGGSGVAFISEAGAGVSLSNIPASSSATIRYASELQGEISIRINGVDAGNISFTTTGAWIGNYNTVTVNRSIPAGTTFEVFFDSGDTAMNIDYVAFKTSDGSTPVATPNPTPTVSPTPSAIPTFVSTPRPTATPRETPNPIPTATALPSSAWRFIVHKPTRAKIQSCATEILTPIVSRPNTNRGDCVQWMQIQNGTYFYLQNRFSGLLMKPDTLADGSPIVVVPDAWRGNWTQWRFEARGDGFGHIVNRGTGKFVQLGGRVNDRIAQQPSSWRGDFTRWRFEAID